MKKKLTILFLIMSAAAFSQETYTALRVVGSDIPVIDGTIDDIWDAVTIVPLEKVPTHSNITVPDPDPDDFYAEWGMLWTDEGMYFLFSIVDDEIRIEDDEPSTSAVPNDKWWTDDNVNILFSKDLVNATFTQWEFAYQYNIDQEEKLSSDDWLNAAEIDEELVETAWYDDGADTYTLETFINWEAFADGSITITPGQIIQLEMRARDDDDGGNWESMFQWSTDNYEIENNGEGMGIVTLSTDTIEGPSGVSNLIAGINSTKLCPSIVKDETTLQFDLLQQAHISIDLYSIDGRRMASLLNETRNAGQQVIPVDMSKFSSGCYLISISNGQESKMLRLIKE